MNIAELLALPLSLSIRLRIGPEPDDVVFIDTLMYEKKKEDIVDFCHSIPNIDQGLSWQLLMPYTGGNGTMAKALVALGELAGAWKMHPSPDFPDLWYKSKMYPMILADSTSQPKRRGSIFTNPEQTKQCGCCGREMGVQGTTDHDLYELVDDMCWECVREGCDGYKKCLLGFDKAKMPSLSPSTKAEEPEEMSNEALEAYLSQFRT
jgi:hypothetical protein